MKVLIVVTWYGEKNKDLNTGIFHYEYANALQNEMEVAIYYPYDNHINNEFEYEIERGVLTFRGRPYSKGKGIIKFYKDLKQIVEIYNPDIIHTNVTDSAGFIGLLGKKFFGIPFINTEHCPLELMRLSTKNKTKINLVLKESAYNIAVSPNLQNQLNSIFKNASYKYICNGVYDPYKLIENTKDKYSKDNKINCSIVASFYSKEIKGIQFLLPAIERVVDDGINIHLHVCGGGEYLEYFQHMAEELNISQAVTFYGHCEKQKVYTIVSQMDFNISASIFESAGVAVQEACMLGRPQVITKSGGADSLIPDEYSIKVDTNSTEALHRGMYEIIEKLADYYNSQIRDYGIKNFSMDAVIKKHLVVYDKVLNKDVEDSII